MEDGLEDLDNRKIKETLNDLIKLYQNISEIKKSDGIFGRYNQKTTAAILIKIRSIYSSFIDEHSDHLDKKKISQILISIGLIDLIMADIDELK
ncbi:MAG: hypothetical protein QY331_01925 [Melioribacteraceae bacterium]|jgi:hypothetical protein|nr:MAG: hypothetical protein QY331_01925 [Melioribacteraceae bacterium]